MVSATVVGTTSFRPPRSYTTLRDVTTLRRPAALAPASMRVQRLCRSDFVQHPRSNAAAAERVERGGVEVVSIDTRGCGMLVKEAMTWSPLDLITPCGKLRGA